MNGLRTILANFWKSQEHFFLESVNVREQLIFFFGKVREKLPDFFPLEKGNLFAKIFFVIFLYHRTYKCEKTVSLEMHTFYLDKIAQRISKQKRYIDYLEW